MCAHSIWALFKKKPNGCKTQLTASSVSIFCNIFFSSFRSFCAFCVFVAMDFWFGLKSPCANITNYQVAVPQLYYRSMRLLVLFFLLMLHRTHTHTQMHSNKCKMLDLLTSNVDSVFVSQFANSLEPFGNRIKCAIPSAKHKLLSDTSNICTLLAEICQEFKHFVCRKNCNKELKMLISLRANEWNANIHRDMSGSQFYPP